jgi:hypothetical protein
VTPFFADVRVFQDHPEAGVVTRQSFESEFTRTGYWVIGIDKAKKAIDDLRSEKEQLRIDDMVEVGRRTGVDAVVVGTITEYNYLDVGYRVQGIATDSGAILWEAGGVQRIPFYRLQIEPALNKLSRKIVKQLVRKGLTADPALSTPELHPQNDTELKELPSTSTI